MTTGKPVTVLVTGSAGQLGSAVTEDLGRDYDVAGFTHHQLDLVDPQAVLDTVHRVKPGVIVNCGGFTDVDGAERAPAAALEVNGFAVRHLARAAAEIGSTLVHFSTDFVFDGTATSPYTEEQAPNPRSTYAVSKLLGEWFARDVPQHYVMRVESLFGGPAVLRSPRRSSLDKIVDAIAEGREVKAFIDRTVSPSYVVDIASAVRGVLDRRPPPGIYHTVNTGSCTWYELAREVERLLERKATIVGVPAASVNLVAERPIYSALSNAKLAALGIQMPTWQQALTHYLGARGLLRAMNRSI
jgi:dTDP-4-dehydrorhamnose reductase